MVSRIGVISRDVREAIITLLAPLPYVLLCTAILAVSTSGPLFFLILGITINFFYIFMRNAVDRLSDGFEGETETLLAPENDSNSKWEAFKRANEDFEKLQRQTDHQPISSFEPTSLIPKIVFATRSLLSAIIAWVLLVLLFATLINFGIYSQIVTKLKNIMTTPGASVLTLLPSAATIIAQLGESILQDIGIENTILVAILTLIPAIIFHTAAVNLVFISEELHSRLLYWWYREDSKLRQFEAPGYITLIGIYIAIIQKFGM